MTNSRRTSRCPAVEKHWFRWRVRGKQFWVLVLG